MIGGEFPIEAVDILNSNNRHFGSPDVFKYSSGRAAFYHILNYLLLNYGIKRVLLPDYLCSSILVPIRKLGLESVFYPIDEQLELQINNFACKYQKGSAVLLINYFGLQNLTPQIELIRSIDEQAIIIEDDVQAYYEFKKPLSGVDFKFTSLRKTFAVPDGGLVKTRHKLPELYKPNKFGQYKAAAALLKSLRDGNFNDEIYLELFEKGESLINYEFDSSISNIAEKLFSVVNEEHVKIRRINNAQYLVGELEKIGIKTILPINEGKVPLFVPIHLANRDKIRHSMFNNEIFCPVHWPVDGLELFRGSKMAQHELSLIVDQRYGRNDMEKLLDALL